MLSGTATSFTQLVQDERPFVESTRAADDINRSSAIGPTQADLSTQAAGTNKFKAVSDDGLGGDLAKGRRFVLALLPLMRGCSEISESTVTDVLQAAGVGMTEAVQMMANNVKAECLLCC